MTLIAIDPGITTGVAVKDVDYTTEKDIWWTDEVDHENLLILLSNMALSSDDTVIIERFATAGKLSKYGLRTIELVGMVHGFCYARHIKYVVQTPQQRETHKAYAKTFVGSYSRSKHRVRSIHENDALAHLLRFIKYQPEAHNGS